jgi:hypothetical protein
MPRKKQPQVGSVVILVNGDIAVIVDHKPSRPKYPWVYKKTVTGGRYKMAAEFVKAVIGKADVDALSEAQPDASVLNALKVGEPFKMQHGGKAVTATYRGTNPRNKKYPVLYAYRGKTWKGPLGSVIGPAEAPAASKKKKAAKGRSEADIMSDIRGVYSSLSPENLTCDGELSRRQVTRKRRQLNSKLKALFEELGREVSEEEAYA